MANAPSNRNSPTGAGGNRPDAAGSSQNQGARSSPVGGMADDSHQGEADKNLFSKASETLLHTAERQKAAGANLMGDMAGAVRRAAGEFDSEVPQAAEYIRYAADQMDGMSDAVRRRDFGQIISELQSFARQQPTAFLGATLLAGFAAVRFLKSSSSNAAKSGAAMRAPQAAPGMARYGEFGGRSLEASTSLSES